MYRLIPLLAGLLAILFAELLMELFMCTPLAPARMRRLDLGRRMFSTHIMEDPELGYRLRAPYRSAINQMGLSLQFTHESAASDASWGYRAGGAQVKSGAADIMVLGGSFTYGWLVSDLDTYPNRLGALAGLSVVNMGVSGYGSSQIAALYRRYGRTFQPRLVVIQLCSNDIVENMLYREWLKHESTHGSNYQEYRFRQVVFPGAWTSRVGGFLFKHSRLFREIMLRRFNRQASRRMQEEYKADSRGMRILQEDLAGLHGELASQGRGLAAVIGPDWPAAPRAKLRALLADQRIPFLDLAGSGAWLYRARELSLWGDGHWNEQGHALAAAEIYRFLRQEGLLPRPVKK